MKTLIALAFMLITTGFVGGDTHSENHSSIKISPNYGFKSECKQLNQHDFENYHGCGFPSSDTDVFVEKKKKVSQLK